MSSEPQEPGPEALAEADRIAQRRAQLYWMLSAQLVEPPLGEAEELEALVGVWNEIAEPVDPACVERIGVLLHQLSGEPAVLARDFQELFVIKGPRYLAPVESAYRGASFEGGSWRFSRLRGPAWAAARRAYADAGLDLAASAGTDADHLSCELQFLAELCKRQASAGRSGDLAALELHRLAQLRFVEEHPLGWIRLLRHRAEQVAEGSYYLEVIRFIEAFLKVEANHLGGRSDVR